MSRLFGVAFDLGLVMLIFMVLHVSIVCYGVVF
jgi:hypothetical protein